MKYFKWFPVFAIVIIFIDIVNSSSMQIFKFEFGKRNADRPYLLYEFSGNTPVPDDYIEEYLKLPPNTTATFVSVQVFSHVKPRVKYRNHKHLVTISFHWDRALKPFSYEVKAWGKLKDIGMHGNHVALEVKAFQFNGTVPAFLSIFRLNMTHGNPNLEKQYTYIRAQYFNPTSKVAILYTMNTTTLTFYVQYPYVEFEIGVTGYAMPSHPRTSTKQEKVLF